MRRTRRIATAVVLAAASISGGCGQRAKGVVTGTVTLDGTPLAEAQIQMVPTTDVNLPTLSGTTDSSGHFTIPVESSSGKPVAGPYAVLVTKFGPRKGDTSMGGMGNLVPPQYGDRNRTPLKAEIKEGQNDLPPFAVTSK